MKMNRRDFSLSGGALVLTFMLDGKVIQLTPAQARAKKLPLRVLSDSEATTLDLIGEAIVPGAKAAGLCHYIDHQLSVKPRDNLLILRYLRVKPPFDSFYTSSLKAVRQAIKKPPADLSAAELSQFIAVMMQKNPEGWPENGTDAPPAPLFYFVLRSDAIDVTYGTMDAFDRLDIPYMAHIEPAHAWAVDP